MNDADAVFLALVRPICLGLPDAYEESAWVGTRWRVRMRTFAHLLAIDGGRPPAYANAAGTDGPACVLMVSARSPDLYATARSGWPYFPAAWGRDLLGVVLGDRVEWDEVAELVTESYRALAPRKLAASVIGPVRLRAAQAPDVEAVAAIWHAGWRDGHLGHVPDELLAHRTPESFAARAAQRVADTVIATVGDCVAGFVMVVDDEVEQLYVAADHRGTGVAAALLSEAERWIAADGHDEAWLAVVAGNARARAFYAHQGWTDSGPIDYAAATATGSVTVPSHRYNKCVP